MPLLSNPMAALGTLNGKTGKPFGGCGITCNGTTARTRCTGNYRCCKRCNNGSPEVTCAHARETCEDAFRRTDLEIDLGEVVQP